MLLQTNSYIVPKEKRVEHTRLVRRFRQTLHRLGCEHFEVYEQVGANWSSGETTGRYVHIMRFRDRKHQLAVQAAERNDAAAQALISEFCELINFPYQQQQGLFAVGFYQSVLPIALPRAGAAVAPTEDAEVVHDSDDDGDDDDVPAAVVDAAATSGAADDLSDVIDPGEPNPNDQIDTGDNDTSPGEPSTRQNV